MTSTSVERVMRAMIASGMVPTAMEGKIRCHRASFSVAQLPVMMLLVMAELDMKYTTNLRKPVRSRSEEHTSELHHGYISYAAFSLKNNPMDPLHTAARAARGPGDGGRGGGSRR